ncbi:Transcriptional coactivator Hfi1/Transcriptional adapter 1 [Melia azedarach]|uniref:Transcriptional coactivator Hfi1/Transcriptional adapter 1 n=1 Tax=Melia azedarach TaxID=155640 RepID=A0ACC1XXM1_MELAZ|nr:Transcriptional coactivator Hfi1/Transcriptional adapter 1 [Melia azedarach]
MVPNLNIARIDTLELKALILKKIGQQRGEKYFDHLSRLLSSKISKSEFDKVCLGTIGRENLPLHNKFIRSIIKNACIAKVPPPKGIKKVGSSLSVKTVNGYQRSSLQSIYGDAFPPSPRKGRSLVNRDRKFRDRPSPLGPLGKPQTVVACEESVSKAPELQSPTELLSLGSRPPVEVVSVEDGEEVEQVAVSPSIQSKSPVTAPLGISMNLGGARKSLCNASIFNNYHPSMCQNSGELPDTRSLRSRLEQKLGMEGISVSMDCVNLLNNGLDAYLKRLIGPCISLAGSRCHNEQSKQNDQLIPGVHRMRYMQRPEKSIDATMLDFRAAMELEPKVLGEDWPIQLEKICLRASEE